MTGSYGENRSDGGHTEDGLAYVGMIMYKCKTEKS